MDKKFFNGLAVGCVLTLLVTLGVVTFQRNSNVLDSKSLTKLDRITDIVEHEYWGEYEKSDIINGIYDGVCFNLDQYSAYLSFEEYEDAVDPDQQFGGIGIRSIYNKYTKVYRVDYVYPDMPGDLAGLQRNDIIEAIDGVDTYGLDMDKMSELIRGEPGTTVSLKVDRDGELMDIDVVRELVDLPNAYAYGLSEEIGYIRILAFTGTVSDEFAAALSSVKSAKGIVLDLRGNSGGTVDRYQAIASQILPSCTLQTIVRKDGSREPMVCESELTEPQYKFVVLVDSGTASAAECLTQAMIDVAGAKVVGEETYGKGVAQEYFQVDANSVLRLTIGYIESPNGVVWNEVGISPDIEIEYEYIGDDFEESDLLMDNQILAGYELLVSEIG